MKKRLLYLAQIIIITLLFFINSNAEENYNNWEYKNPNPTTSNLYNIAVNGNNIIVTGDYGYFAISNDAGKSWEKMKSTFNKKVIGANFFTNTKSNFFAFTEDGWYWNNSTSPTFIKHSGLPNIVYTKTAFDPLTNTCWAIGKGSNSIIVNDNITKNVKIIPSLEDLTSIKFNNKTGIISTASGKLFVSTNSGTEWEEKADFKNHLNDLDFFSDYYLVVGKSGYLGKTINYSLDKRETKININTKVDLNSIYVVNDKIVFIAGNSGKLFYSNDGATTWTEINLGGYSHNIHSISGNKDYIFAVGENGSVFSIHINTMEVNFLSNSISNFNLNSVAVFTDKELNKTVFVAGKNNTLFSSKDNGENWIQNSISGQTKDIDFTSIECINADSVFVTTKDGEVFRTINGGQLWTEIPFENNRKINKIKFNRSKFPDLNLGILVGEKSLIYRTLNNGKNWTLSSFSENKNINSVDFNEEVCIAVGENGLIIYSEDQGETWNSISDIISLPNEISLLNFTAVNINRDKTYIGTDKGVLIIIDHLKETITATPLETLNKITDIASTFDNSFTIITTEEGEMYYTGASFEYKIIKINKLTEYNLNAVALDYFGSEDSSDVDIWVVGNTGTILNNKLKVLINEEGFEEEDSVLPLNNVKIYPNPANELLIIEKDDIQKVEIYDISYKFILAPELSNTANHSFINLAKIPAGTYLLKIYTVNSSEFIKFIKK